MYACKRTVNQKGVTIASQRRYVRYIEKLPRVLKQSGYLDAVQAERSASPDMLRAPEGRPLRRIRLYDVTGENIKERPLAEQQLQNNVPSLDSGFAMQKVIGICSGSCRTPLPDEALCPHKGIEREAALSAGAEKLDFALFHLQPPVGEGREMEYWPAEEIFSGQCCLGRRGHQVGTLRGFSMVTSSEIFMPILTCSGATRNECPCSRCAVDFRDQKDDNSERCPRKALRTVGY